jgi:hypothetical protein
MMHQLFHHPKMGKDQVVLVLKQVTNWLSQQETICLLEFAFGAWCKQRRLQKCCFPFLQRFFTLRCK